MLAVDGLVDMTRIGTGVVYGDDEGRVVYAADDGSRELLGHKDPDVPVAATAESGWAAWVETAASVQTRSWSRGDHRPHGGQGRGRRGRTRVVAVDGEVVYYIDAAGAHSVVPFGSPGFRS